MEEDSIINKNGNGIVNHGFTVEFSSEDEDISDVDVSNISFAPKERTSVFSCASSINKSELTPAVPISNVIPTTTDTITKSIQVHPIANGSNNAGENGQPYSTSTLSSALPATMESQQQQQQQQKSGKTGDNAHTAAMLPAKSILQTEAVSLIPNGATGKNTTTEIKKSNVTGLNNGTDNRSNDALHSKEYFRDVRLSLDTSKPVIVGGELPFHSSINSRKSYSIQSDSDSPCESCTRVVLRHYQKLLKYVVQRPLFCFSVWTMFYIFWGDDALPGGSLFALTILELTALFLGYLAELIELPGLLGMMAAGLILRNVPYIDVAKDFDLSVSSPLRSVSIVILLVRGAMGVNPVNIVKFKNIIPPLVIGSCVLEALAGSVAVYYILDFPVEWAALMGCIMSAMSGVAVLPYLAPTEKYLSSKADLCSPSRNYQNVIAIVRTACGLDAMIAICMADVALGFIVSEGDVSQGVMKGAVEVIIGGAFGIVWGLLAGFLLDGTSNNEKRSMTILSCGVMSFMGLPKIGYGRAAPLAVFAGVLITTTIWKKRQVGGSNNEQLAATYTIFWYMFQPLLFGIIGARTDFDRVDWTVVWKGLICLAISLCVRFVTTFSVTTIAGGKLSIKERIYICIAWIPKGTVQAALGPLALDTVMGADNLASPDVYEDLGYKIMNLSAVTFIAAALLGSLSLRFIGPRLLSQK